MRKPVLNRLNSLVVSHSFDLLMLAKRYQVDALTQGEQNHARVARLLTILLAGCRSLCQVHDQGCQSEGKRCDCLTPIMIFALVPSRADGVCSARQRAWLAGRGEARAGSD